MTSLRTFKASTRIKGRSTVVVRSATPGGSLRRATTSGHVVIGSGSRKADSRAPVTRHELGSVMEHFDSMIKDHLRESFQELLHALTEQNLLPGSGGAHDPVLQALLSERTAALLEKTPALEDHADANAVLRADFAARTELWTALQVAEFAQSKANNRHATASRWVSDKRIFGVLKQQTTLYPAFQFNSNTQKPYDEVKEIIAALGQDYEGWSLAIWFITFNDWLDGKSPLDIWPDGRSRVVAAAKEERELFHG